MLEANAAIDKRPSGGAKTIPWRHIFASALLLTALNSLKPAHVDDTVYLDYAAEFAAHPLHPYAFEFGSPYVVPANNILVPPVAIYWLGLGTTLFGEQLLLLQWWLFPWALILAWSVDRIAACLAPNLRAALVWFCVISPTILPGFNFMLDVPALALSLCALAMAMRATERNSWTLALGAGLLAGLAIQTKYTGIVASVTIFLWCALQRRPWQGALALGVAIALAVGWECFTAATTGESHFLVHFRQRQGGAVKRALHLILPLISHLAGVAPAVALLGLIALKWKMRYVVVVGSAMICALAALALFPSQAPFITHPDGDTLLSLSNLVYGLLAVPLVAAMVGVAGALARRNGEDYETQAVNWFLLLWLALELGAYFALSPFPATRRVMGPLLVLTLMAGRLASLRSVRPRLVAALAACGAALALFVFVVDLHDACADRTVIGALLSREYDLAEDANFWHLTCCGANHYANRDARLHALQLNRVSPRAGDLLAVYDSSDLRDVVRRNPQLHLSLIDTVGVGDNFPWRASPGYYSGRTPLEYHRGERVRLLVYRVVAVE